VSPRWFEIGISILTFLLVRRYLANNARLANLSRMVLQPKRKRPLHLYAAGASIGVTAVIAWPLAAATGRNSGLGITTPTANSLQYTVTGDEGLIDWGVLLVLGLFVGAFFAAKATGEFRIRMPDATTAMRSVVGGLMMGVGASMAGGCTVGN